MTIIQTAGELVQALHKAAALAKAAQTKYPQPKAPTSLQGPVNAPEPAPSAPAPAGPAA